MPIVQHEFTKNIIDILNNFFPNQGDKTRLRNRMLLFMMI